MRLNTSRGGRWIERFRRRVLARSRQGIQFYGAEYLAAGAGRGLIHRRRAASGEAERQTDEARPDRAFSGRANRSARQPILHTLHTKSLPASSPSDKMPRSPAPSNRSPVIFPESNGSSLTAAGTRLDVSCTAFAPKPQQSEHAAGQQRPSGPDERVLHASRRLQPIPIANHNAAISLELPCEQLSRRHFIHPCVDDGTEG